MYRTDFLKRHEHGIAAAEVPVDIVQLLSTRRGDGDGNADIFAFYAVGAGDGVLRYICDMVVDDSDDLILEIGVSTTHDLDGEVTGELKQFVLVDKHGVKVR